MTPNIRLLLASLGAIWVLKAVSLVTRRRPSTATGLAVFLFAWPGVIPDHFRERQSAQAIDPLRFLAAWARMLLGAGSVILLAVYAPRVSGHLLGLAGIVP